MPNSSQSLQSLLLWAKESALKNEDGMPMVLYHGTNTEFSCRDPKRNREEGAFFATSDPKIASDFALYRTVWSGANVMPLYCDAKNVLRIECDCQDIRRIEANYQDPRMMPGESLRSFARRMGHDAVVFKNVRDGAGPDIPRAGDVYLLFDSVKMKSALGNHGTYDPLDPDFTDQAARNKANSPTPLDQWMAYKGLRNETGEPLRLYHGTQTPENLTRFLPGGSHSSIQSGDAYGVAAYFTTSPREAGFFAKNNGAILPVYIRGEILDVDGDLTEAQSQRLTALAHQLLLPSDRARFECGRSRRVFEDVQDARDFFDSQKKNWEVFGDRMDRAFPVALAEQGAYVVEFTDFDAAISIRSGKDAFILFSAVGWDNLCAAGFDGLQMSKEDGNRWVVMHRPDGNVKSALGNSGAFDPNDPDITDRRALAAQEALQFLANLSVKEEKVTFHV